MTQQPRIYPRISTKLNTYLKSQKKNTLTSKATPRKTIQINSLDTVKRHEENIGVDLTSDRGLKQSKLNALLGHHAFPGGSIFSTATKGAHKVVSTK